jgi:two-component system, chemotaxis family, sensor kinase CheA
MDQEQLLDDPLIQEFLVESSELLDHAVQDLVVLESAPAEPETLNRIFRAVHTIKGTAGFLGFDDMVRISHRAEDVLNDLRKGVYVASPYIVDLLLKVADLLRSMLADIGAKRTGAYDLGPLVSELEAIHAQTATPQEPPKLAGAPPIPQVAVEAAEASNPAEPVAPPAAPEAAGKESAPAAAAKAASTNDAPASMRVDVAKLDNLINMVGELALERNRLLQLSRSVETQNLTLAELGEQLSHSTTRLSFITEELQTAGLKTRMLPIDTVFRRLPRIVRDLSRQLGKEVDLQIQGGETELDRIMAEHLGDPLIHLIRNSMDHGVEMPEQREAGGKKRIGTIRVEARTEGDHVVVSISDDGAGIDPDRVAHKAVEKGLVTPEQVRGMERREILDLIFLPGLSTRDAASDVSGRGVGMDVVNTNLKKINGSVELDSTPGKGTCVTLKLPLTMVIFPVLFVEVGKETYGLPMRAVVETLRVSNGQIHVVEGRDVLHANGRTFPLLRLHRILSVPGGEQREQKAVIASLGSRRLALLVDRLVGEEATVIKPLSSFFGRSPGVAGATISGDGRVRLLLDLAALVELANASSRVETVHV